MSTQTVFKYVGVGRGIIADNAMQEARSFGLRSFCYAALYLYKFLHPTLVSVYTHESLSNLNCDQFVSIKTSSDHQPHYRSVWQRGRHRVGSLPHHEDLGRLLNSNELQIYSWR